MLAIKRSGTDAFLNKYFTDAGSKFSVKYQRDPQSWPAEEDIKIYDKMLLYII